MIVASERIERDVLPDDLGSLATKAALLRSCVAYLGGEVGRAYELARVADADGAPTAGALSGMLVGMTSYMRGERRGGHGTARTHARRARRRAHCGRCR